jgi:hypothetical protein
VVIAVSAGVPASTLNKDILLLNNSPNSHNNKGDILMPTLGDQDKGWPMLADLTGTHPACDSSCQATRRDPKSSILRAEKRKNNIYLDLAATHDITFTPLAFECYGAFSEKFEKLIRKLCRMRAEILDIEETSVLNYWFRRISCTLQRANSRAISGRILDIVQSNSTHPDGYLMDDTTDLEYNNNDTMLPRS